MSNQSGCILWKERQSAMVNNSTNINKNTNTSHFKSLNAINTTAKVEGNHGPGLGQTQAYDVLNGQGLESHFCTQ